MFDIVAEEFGRNEQDGEAYRKITCPNAVDIILPRAQHLKSRGRIKHFN